MNIKLLQRKAVLNAVNQFLLKVGMFEKGVMANIGEYGYERA